MKYYGGSTTGSNKQDVDDLDPSYCSFVKYYSLNDDEHWKIKIIQEVINIKHTLHEVEGFTLDEVDEIIKQLCCS